MSLVGEERKKYILHVLDTKGKVKVNSLAEELKVSTETIRRHLEELEKENKLKKVYGGAVKISFEKEEPPYYERSIRYLEEKRKIGQKAAELIYDNEVIAIDVGTTTLQIIKHLAGKKNLTILTNSIAVLTELVDYINKGIFTGKILFIGGEINTKQLSVSGSISEKFMENFYIDKAFIAIGGISIDYGITGYEPNECMLSKKIIENVKQVIVLSDHSKIGVRNYFQIAKLDDIDVIVCDEAYPIEWEEKLNYKDVKWITAD
ncbi:DeoR/GlpR transcriptional regulator [Clostridium sp. 19966]|uniref:DeoR/GlpR family DNA-binding transcription regulator n=1 Tax=Clostridium sp. 19966 TaxID=2768166 RepID=UPI0028E00132|nr:DeoR/GlpR family DNA-binding transcription regulator [Clostridium sp. 19966]MDT8715987.1 DeoR/GlpR transcriptional regulator [Clostridium sp. 19966]